jgi:hypothetical protein
MSKNKDYDLTFSCKMHDRDGDVTDSGVLLHLGNGVILRFDNPDELEKFSDDIKSMLPELKDTYSWS